MVRIFTRQHFVLPYFLLNKSFGFGYAGQIVFVIDGFKSWKKVRNGKNYTFLKKDYNSFHNIAETLCKDLMN